MLYNQQNNYNSNLEEIDAIINHHQKVAVEPISWWFLHHLENKQIDRFEVSEVSFKVSEWKDPIITTCST